MLACAWGLSCRLLFLLLAYRVCCALDHGLQELRAGTWLPVAASQAVIMDVLKGERAAMCPAPCLQATRVPDVSAVMHCRHLLPPLVRSSIHMAPLSIAAPAPVYDPQRA